MVIKLTKNGNISNNVKDRKPLSHSVLQGLLDDILQISIVMIYNPDLKTYSIGGVRECDLC